MKYYTIDSYKYNVSMEVLTMKVLSSKIIWSFLKNSEV